MGPLLEYNPSKGFVLEVGVRKLLVSAVFAVAALASTVTPAAAWWNWCEEDPAVAIVTPGQQTVQVWVTIQAAGISNPALLSTSTVTYVATPDQGGTRVLLGVKVPKLDTHYATHIIVSSQPYGQGTVYGQSEGFTTARDIHVAFELAAR